MEQRDLLAALDSPLCPALAPELHRFHAKVYAILAPVEGGCTPCQETKRARELALVQIEMMDLINAHPEIVEVLPQLIATGKQANAPL